jgi:DNA-directed RNA polymerase I subunit RPA43
MAPILESDDYSLLHMERISQYISLPPSCLSNPLPAVCASIFSPLLLSYYPPARGIVLAYEDAQLSDSPPVSSEEKVRLAQEKRKSNSRHRHEESDTDEDEDEAEDKPKQLLLHIHNEYSAPFLWATATFLVWRPATGSWISARVTQQASTHLTLSHLNSFPISILRQHLPNGWTWTPSNSNYNSGGGDEGWWTNEDGMPIEDVLRVRIRDFEGRMDGKGQGRGGLKIDGSLVTEEEEQTRGKEGEGDKRKRREGRVKKGSLKTRVPLPGEVVEVD